MKADLIESKAMLILACKFTKTQLIYELNNLIDSIESERLNEARNVSENEVKKEFCKCGILKTISMANSLLYCSLCGKHILTK